MQARRPLGEVAPAFVRFIDLNFQPQVERRILADDDLFRDPADGKKLDMRVGNGMIYA